MPAMFKATGLAATEAPVASINDLTTFTSSIPAPAGLTYEAPSSYLLRDNQAWLNRSEDAISQRMSRNFSASTDAKRLNGLGRAMMERFKTNTSDFAQSVTNFSPASIAGSTGVDQAAKSALAGIGNNASTSIALSIRTRSGTVVNLELIQQRDGLAVKMRASGELTADETEALGKLAEGFEKTIQSFAADQPKVDIADLADFDTSVLASVDLKAQVLRDGESFSLTFHADKTQRNVKLVSPTDNADIKLDLRNAAIIGTAAQREEAIAEQVRQMTEAGERGQAKTGWIAMVNDAFSALHRSYGTDEAAAQPVDTHTPRLTPLLSGLADFELNVKAAPKASNPMRLQETDKFDYRTSQATTVAGNADQPSSIRQRQTASLNASYHSGLDQPGLPELTSEKKSQNYRFTEIVDHSSREVTIVDEPLKPLQASMEESTHQSTRVRKYAMGLLVDDQRDPKDRFISVDLVDKLRELQQKTNVKLLFQ